MPVTNQYTWSHKELVALLVKAAGIHEGRWYLMMNFALGAGNVGPSEDAVSPAAIIGITNVGIQRELPDQKAPASLVVDAAEVNPVPVPEPASARQRRGKR
jgi:hypothetical protein